MDKTQLGTVINSFIIKQIQLSMIAIVIMTFVFSAYFYDQFPERVATHWNADGLVVDFQKKE